MIANFQARNHNLNNSTKITASEDMVTRMVAYHACPEGLPLVGLLESAAKNFVLRKAESHEILTPTNKQE